MPSPLADVSTVNFGKKEAEQGPRLVPALTIVSHPVPSRAGDRFLLQALTEGREVLLSRNAPEFARPGAPAGAPLGDPSLSRKPIILAPGAQGRVRLFVEEGGTPVVASEPVKGEREFGPAGVAAGVPLELGGRVVLLLHQVDLALPESKEPLGMVGESTGVRRVRRHIEQVADLEVPVLVRGETGTGKELVAQAIHARSLRGQGPFISVNLGAIPKELAAAELFGARRGAYTGATQDREGFFRMAQGGTLFLDEVGEASPEVQVMLLRVLETGEMYPVGGQKPVRTDVRLIAATDAHLEEQIRDGRFKAPLMHRLAGYSLRVPPLRERREDIGALFIHFAREELGAIGEAHRLSPEDTFADPWLPASLASLMVRYDWPGNIRQLRNVTRQLVIGSRGQPRLSLDPRLANELDFVVPSPGRSPEAFVPQEKKTTGERAPAEERGAPRRKPSEISERELLSTLRACGWDLQAAADRLGITRSSIYDLIDKSPSLRTAGDLSNEEISRCFKECGGDVDAMAQRLEVSRRGLLRRVKDLGLTPKSS